MPAQNLTPEVVRQHYILKMDQTTTNGKLNQDEKWRWIDHTLRKPPETIIRQAIIWNHLRRGEEEGHETPCKKRHGKRNKGDGIHQERDGEDGHGQTTVAFLGRRSTVDGRRSTVDGRWSMVPARKQASK